MGILIALSATMILTVVLLMWGDSKEKKRIENEPLKVGTIISKEVKEELVKGTDDMYLALGVAIGSFAVAGFDEPDKVVKKHTVNISGVEYIVTKKEYDHVKLGSEVFFKKVEVGYAVIEKVNK